jgi:hypothetical protein
LQPNQVFSAAMERTVCQAAVSARLPGLAISGPATARPFDGDRHFRYLLLRAAYLVIP